MTPKCHQVCLRKMAKSRSPPQKKIAEILPLRHFNILVRCLTQNKLKLEKNYTEKMHNEQTEGQTEQMNGHTHRCLLCFSPCRFPRLLLDTRSPLHPRQSTLHTDCPHAAPNQRNFWLLTAGAFPPTTPATPVSNRYFVKNLHLNLQIV